MTTPETPDAEPVTINLEPTHFAPIDVVLSAINDIRDSEHKLRLSSATLVGIGTLAVNGLKIPLVTAPSIALEALQYTDNPLVSGMVTGLIFAGWTWGASGVVNAAGNHYPEAKDKAKERFPKQVEFMVGALPGLHAEQSTPSEEKGRFRRVGSSALSHLKRGATIVGAGATFYVVAAQLEEKPKEDINRMRRLAALDGGIVIAAGSAAAAELVAVSSDSHPAFAEFIQVHSTDTKTLLAMAASLTLSQGIATWRKNRKAAGAPA